MNDRPGSNPAPPTPSKRHLNRTEIDHLLDGLAVGSGRTRETLDSEIQTLSASNANAGIVHLGFREAAALDELSPERLEHVDDCQFCRAMVETVYVSDVAAEEFEKKVQSQLAEIPRPPRNGKFAWAIALVALVISAGFGAAYQKATVQLAELRSEPQPHFASTTSASPAALERTTVQAEIAPFPDFSAATASGSSSASPRPATQAQQANLTEQHLQELEMLNRQLNEELIAARAELARRPTMEIKYAAAKNDQLWTAARHIRTATELVERSQAMDTAGLPEGFAARDSYKRIEAPTNGMAARVH